MKSKLLRETADVCWPQSTFDFSQIDDRLGRLHSLEERVDVFRFLGGIAQAQMLERVLEAVAATKSPIEELLLYGLIVAGLAEYETVQLRNHARTVPLPVSGGGPGLVEIEIQPARGNLHPDFEVALSGAYPGDGRPVILVECDGHDYHERTRQQAARDKKRDRALVGLGFNVLRFTGSEIFAGPVKCAGEVLSYLDAALLRANKPLGSGKERP